MAEILLIRHGQASFGTDNYDRLSRLGERQAELTGAYLQQSGVRLDACYSGTLERQLNTAAGVARVYAEAGVELPAPVTDVGFNELSMEAQISAFAAKLASRDADVAENLPRVNSDKKALQKVLRTVFQHWVASGEPDVEGQTWPAFSSAIEHALQRVVREQGAGRSTAVFTSGGVIATIVARVLGLGDSGVYSVFEPVINCSVTRLIYSGSKISLSSFNDHGFLSLLGAINREDGLITYR